MRKFRQIQEIISGIYHYIFKNKKIEDIAAKRKKECDKCMFNSSVMKKLDKDFKPFRRDEHCIECQCNLKLKQRSMKTRCPNNIW